MNSIRWVTAHLLWVSSICILAAYGVDTHWKKIEGNNS